MVFVWGLIGVVLFIGGVCLAFFSVTQVSYRKAEDGNFSFKEQLGELIRNKFWETCTLLGVGILIIGFGLLIGSLMALLS